MDAAEHFEDGDGVCGRDEGAEEETLEQRRLIAEETDGVVGYSADGEGGEDGCDDGEQGNGESLLAQAGEIEEERSGEEKEREHSVEDEAFEVDLAQDAKGPVVGGGPGRSEEYQGNRGDCGEEHGADGVRQLQDAGAHPAEDGGYANEDADDEKHDLGYRSGERLCGWEVCGGCGGGTGLAAIYWYCREAPWYC